MENLCCPRYLTTNQVTYRPVGKDKYAIKRFPKQTQTDPSLVSGYFSKNLVVNGVQVKSRVWPHNNWGIEEYKEYMQRLKCCKDELYRMYRFPDADPSVIERMLRDLERTVYQVDFGSNEYVPRRRDAMRILKTVPGKSHFKYYATTYGTYYNRIEELAHYLEFLRGKSMKFYSPQLSQELRAIHRNGQTTYYSDLCVPAMVMSHDVKVPEGPVDRYTFRRV